MKKITVLALALSLVPSVIFAEGALPPSASKVDVNIYINKTLQNVPDKMGKAYIDSKTNRTMVPVRFISEALGATVNFIPELENQKAGFLIGTRGKIIRMNIDENEASVMEKDAEKKVVLDSAAILYDGRSYVPVRFLSEALGFKVEYTDGNVYIEGKRVDESK